MDKLDLILQELSDMKGEMKSISNRLDSLENKMDTIIEDHQTTRDGVNRLLEWADECGYVVKFPLPKL